MSDIDRVRFNGIMKFLRSIQRYRQFLMSHWPDEMEVPCDHLWEVEKALYRKLQDYPVWRNPEEGQRRGDEAKD